MNQKKIKGVVIGILLVAAIVFGVSQLRIQSVTTYQQEQKRVAQDLGLDTTESATSSALVADGSSGAGEVSSSSDHKEKTADTPSTEPKEKQSPSNKSTSTTGSKSGKGKDAAKTTSPRKTAAPTTQGHNGGSAASGDGSGTGGSSVTDPSGNGNVQSPQNGIDSTVIATQPPTTKNPVTQSPETEKITCKIAVVCDSLADQKDKADDSIQQYIPANGKIVAEVSVKLDKGATAYTALEQVCKAKNVALDAEYTAMYKSYYVKGIGHIYEKQAGDMSGWIYKVNGLSPNMGASSYKLSEGDTITWAYTCDGKTT